MRGKKCTPYSQQGEATAISHCQSESRYLPSFPTVWTLGSAAHRKGCSQESYSQTGKAKANSLAFLTFPGLSQTNRESKSVGTSSICHSKGSIIRRPNLPQRLWPSVVSTATSTVLWSMEMCLTNTNCNTYISEYLGISENVPTPENELIVGCKAQMRRMSSQRSKKRRQRKRSSKRNSSHFRILCSPITVK